MLNCFSPTPVFPLLFFKLHSRTVRTPKMPDYSSVLPILNQRPTLLLLQFTQQCHRSKSVSMLLLRSVPHKVTINFTICLNYFTQQLLFVFLLLFFAGHSTQEPSFIHTPMLCLLHWLLPHTPTSTLLRGLASTHLVAGYLLLPSMDEQHQSAIYRYIFPQKPACLLFWWREIGFHLYTEKKWQ